MTAERWYRLVCIAVAVYLLARAPAVIQPGAPESFDGVGLLSALPGPLSTGALVALLATTVGALGVVALSVATAPAVVVGAVGVLVLTTHRSSFGQILWFDIVMVLHLLIVAASIVLVRVGDGTQEQRSLIASWGIRLCAITTTTTYFVSGVTKLRVGGLDWVSSVALERHIGFTAARAEALGGRASPVAGSVVDIGLTSSSMAALVLVLELSAPLALLHRRIAWGWALLIWLMHVVIAATMFIVFHWPLLGFALFPVIAISSRTRHLTTTGSGANTFRPRSPATARIGRCEPHRGRGASAD